MDAPPTPTERPAPQHIRQYLCIWHTQAKWMRITHTLLILAATISAVIAASPYKDYTIYGQTISFSIIAAIAINIVAAFNLGQKANGFRNAWRILNAAIMRYEQDANFTTEQLIKEYEKGELLIGDVKETSSK